MSVNLAPLLSSEKMDWATPKEVFDLCCEQAGHTDLELDVCATRDNAKCEMYFSPKFDGLKQNWAGRKCWMNPPYGRDIHLWVRKAAESNARIVVALLPARTDTNWWHRYVVEKAYAIYFIRGRIKFEGAPSSAPFPSAVVVWDRAFYDYPTPIYSTFDAYRD